MHDQCQCEQCKRVRAITTPEFHPVPVIAALVMCLLLYLFVVPS